MRKVPEMDLYKVITQEFNKTENMIYIQTNLKSMLLPISNSRLPPVNIYRDLSIPISNSVCIFYNMMQKEPHFQYIREYVGQFHKPLYFCTKSCFDRECF